MPLEPDFQAKAISLGLQTLLDLLETPVAMSALELSKNATVAAQYSLLKRLNKSLLQYLERDGKLFYVALIGHFSAGKSSTVNSVLESWQTQFERKTDFHPTDKTITLITRERNSDSLIGVIREGTVAIRLQKVENAILDQIVLVDTPGTGDPDFFDEVARDFLPICDLILFVFSAASPLDASDVPLLMELHKRLPFIPIHFVVTRADELRADANIPLTESNFDAAKATQFLESAVSRVNALLTPQVYQSGSFTLIDNRTKFRVEVLRTFLRQKCDVANPNAHISMHMNKLQFYLSGARNLRDFFAGSLDHKLSEVNRIVDAAARNIAKYQEIVQISNSNLTKTWVDAAAAINKASSHSTEVLRAPAALPADYIWLPNANGKRIDILKDMNRDAKFAAQSIALSAKSTWGSAIRDEIYKLHKNLGETSVPKLTAANHMLQPPGISIQIRPEDLLSTTVAARRYTELRDAEVSALRETASELRRQLKDLDDLINKRDQLNACSEIINTARSSFVADLSKFFHNVELYRTGVFSHTTKESIATLGIGKELDKLEAEFTNEDKERFSSEAVAQLFPNVDELIAGVGTNLLSESGKLRPLIEEARSLRLDRIGTSNDALADALDEARELLVTDLTQQAQSDIDRFSSDFNGKLASAILAAKSRYDRCVRTFRAERRKSYGIACAMSGAIWLVAILAINHRQHPAPRSAVGELALSIIAGALLETGTVFFVRWWKSLPKLIDRTEEEVHASLDAEVRQITSTALGEFKLDSINEAVLTAWLSQKYNSLLALNNESWKVTGAEFLQVVKELQSKFLLVRQEHLTSIEGLRESASKYFVDSTRNITLLTEVGQKIKERAIEPSFQLLNATREKLLSVKQRVIAVEFN